MPCEVCCKKDEQGNFIDEPCCGHSGICDAGPVTGDISNCICCGGEMFKENGDWFHHTQKDIPYSKRGRIHFGGK